MVQCLVTFFSLLYGNILLVCISDVPLGFFFSSFYLFCIFVQILWLPSFSFVPLNKVRVYFIFLVQPMKIGNVGFCCVFCSVFLPHNERLDFSVSTDVDCFLQMCLFGAVPHLALLSLRFGTKLLSQTLLSETAASSLQYENVWLLTLEESVFVSSS